MLAIQINRGKNEFQIERDCALPFAANITFLYMVGRHMKSIK